MFLSVSKNLRIAEKATFIIVCMQMCLPCCVRSQVSASTCHSIILVQQLFAVVATMSRDCITYKNGKIIK